MQTTVKIWLEKKGYGFLDNGDGRDILVHKNELVNCTYLKPGATVTFSCDVGEKGLVAKGVRLARRNPRENAGREQDQRWHGVMT